MSHVSTQLKLCKTSELPFYVYYMDQIDSNIKRFKSLSYPYVKIHFASMANDNPVLLEMLREAEIGIFVNSLKHLALADRAKFAKEDIIFASTGISEYIMKELVERKIWINLDSISQISLYGRLAPGGSAGLRLNIDERSKNNVFIGAESRIGVLESEMDEAFTVAAANGLSLRGPHVYLGTDVTNIDDLISGVERTIELSDRFDTLDFIDVGGGFPIEASRFNFDLYDSVLQDRMSKLSRRRGYPVRLILEPGRSMFGDSGSFFAQVTDVKERPDRWIVCTNASAALIPRAMFYEDYNPVYLVTDEERSLFDKPVDVVGSTTYSRDFMARGLSLPLTKIGDWLRFDHAGSYCYSMITRFLGQSLPPEYLADSNDELKLIRKGEELYSEGFL